MHVLEGARRTLSAQRPALMVEANDEALRAQGASTDALLAFLRDELDSGIFVFSSATGGVEPMGEDSSASANIVAVPSERRSKILARVRGLLARLGRDVVNHRIMSASANIHDLAIVRTVAELRRRLAGCWRQGLGAGHSCLVGSTHRAPRRSGQIKSASTS